MELSYGQLKFLLNKYPKFDLSYETVSQKTDLENYDMSIAIALGKKCIFWNTYYNNKDVCYLFDLNRDRQISKGYVIKRFNIHPLSHGTIIYGTIAEEPEDVEKPNKMFVLVEDIYYYKGVYIKNAPFSSKIAYIKEYIDIMNQYEHEYIFTFPYIQYFDHKKDILKSNLNEETLLTIGYQVHHLQYRSSTYVVPYLNVLNSKKLNFTPQNQDIIQSLSYYRVKYTFEYIRPQYKYTTNFIVKADLQNDIYHLFAFGNKKSHVYYNIAYIPDYKTSVFMNDLFRNIKENKNLDYIEESEDEEDFENINIDKYVDLNKTLHIECKFNRKFKKWVPIRKIENNEKIVHIGKLVKDYYL